MNQKRSDPLVSVIIPTRNRVEELKRCLDSVRREAYTRKEVIVVDDASTEPVERTIGKDYPEVTFVRNEKRAFLACSRNRGAEVSAGEYLFFLDDDNVLGSDVVGPLVQPLATHAKVAVTMPVIYYLSSPNRVWTSRIEKGRFPGFYGLRTDVPSGYRETFCFHNSFLVRKSTFEKVGGFDCVNFPMRFSELDFVHRLHRAGYTALSAPSAKVWHDIGWALVHVDSKRAYYTERNRILLLKRYYPKGDLRFYEVCVLPFLSSYYLIHHSLSTTDGRMGTAGALLRGVLDGLRVSAKGTPSP